MAVIVPSNADYLSRKSRSPKPGRRERESFSRPVATRAFCGMDHILLDNPPQGTAIREGEKMGDLHREGTPPLMS
jgi:hypothetical protein